MILASDIILLGAVILIVGCIAALILKMPLGGIIFWGIVYIYIVTVLAITLFPIPYQSGGEMLPAPHNLVPLRTIAATLRRGLTPTALIQIGGNILIAAPYGVLLYILTRKRTALLLLSLLFPLAIESLQLAIGAAIGFCFRSFDIDDFILNSLGAWLGIIAGRIALKKHRDKIRRAVCLQKG